MSKRYVFALLATTTVALGCGGTFTPVGDGTSEAASASGSYVTDAVVSALQTSGASMRGRTWTLTTDDTFDDGWLIQTPPARFWGTPYASLPIAQSCTDGGCDPDFALRRCSSDADCSNGGSCAPVAATVRTPGAAPTQLCVGHSDVIYDEMYRVMTSGQQMVDVTSLLPPDGRYQAAMRNAITYLANSGRPVTVRLIFGDYPVQGVVNSKDVLSKLVRDVPASSPIKVYVGNYRSSDAPPSWNHSKIVAADGQVAIVGGHNLWTQHYLDKNPVHDISVRVRGSAAAAAHRFANEQWAWTCANKSSLTYLTWSVWSNGFAGGKINNDCAPAFNPPAPATAAGGSTVIAVGRLAGIDSSGRSNQSDDALLAMIGSAQKTVRISQQDLGPAKAAGITLNAWPEGLFAKLGTVMGRGVDVYIVLSNTGAIAGGLTATTAAYSNGWTMQDVARQIRDYLAQHPQPGLPSGDALNTLLCGKLHIAPLRFSADDAFPDGTPLPNHAKFAMVDDRAFFVGSQNLYNAGLTEFGFITDDAARGAEMRDQYWSRLWSYSSRAAVTGSEAAQCALR